MILYDNMLAAADPSQVEGLSRFFKTGPGQYGEGDKFLGIKVPVTRGIVKACWREVDFEELEHCIRSEYHEVRLAALLTLVEIFSHAKRWPVGPAMTGLSCPVSTVASCPATTGHPCQDTGRCPAPCSATPSKSSRKTTDSGI